MLQRIKWFVDSLFTDIWERLVSERGEMSLEDKKDPEDTENPDKEFEEKFKESDDGDDSDSDDDDSSSEEDKSDEDDFSELDEVKVLGYLKSKGIEAESLNDVSTRYKGFKTLQQKHETTAQILKALRKHDGFDDLLAESIAGFDEDRPKKVPASMSQLTPEQMVKAQEQVGTLAQPALTKLKSDIKAELRVEKFAADNPEVNEHWELMKEIAAEDGTTGTSVKTLTRLLNAAKAQRAEEAKALLDGGKNNQVNKPKTVGIPPTGGDKGGGGKRDPKKPKSEADYEKDFKTLIALNSKDA